jgi:hypothetical protein
MEDKPNHNKAYFVNQFVIQLEKNLIKEARKLSKLYQQGKIPSQIVKPVQNLFGKALDLIDEFKQNPDRIKKVDRDNFSILVAETNFFKNIVNSLKPILEKSTLNRLVHLIDDINHFLLNWRYSQKLYMPGAKIPNRPQNIILRTAWYLIIQRVLSQTLKFPRHKQVNEELRKLDLKLSKETHGDWKKRFLNGKF